MTGGSTTGLEGWWSTGVLQDTCWLEEISGGSVCPQVTGQELFLSAVSISHQSSPLLLSPEPNLAHGGAADQSKVLWSYGPALAVDGREETCSYTTSDTEGRWWRVGLGVTRSVGQVRVVLATPPDQVVVYLLTGHHLTHCHPLQSAGDQPPVRLSDRITLVTDCRGLKGDSLVVKDLREADDYFGVCEVEIFRFQEILSCGVPDSPEEGGVVVTGGGYSAHFTCAEGHTLQGGRQVQCSEEGWRGSLTPQCLAVTCDPPAPTSHGYIEISPYTGQYRQAVPASS